LLLPVDTGSKVQLVARPAASEASMQSTSSSSSMSDVDLPTLVSPGAAATAPVDPVAVAAAIAGIIAVPMAAVLDAALDADDPPFDSIPAATAAITAASAPSSPFGPKLGVPEYWHPSTPDSAPGCYIFDTTNATLAGHTPIELDFEFDDMLSLPPPSVGTTDPPGLCEEKMDEN
jgi:hypothetical protein